MTPDDISTYSVRSINQLRAERNALGERLAAIDAELEALRKAIAELEPRAAFGDQCYQDRCENAYVEQSVVKKLQAELEALRAQGAQLVDALNIVIKAFDSACMTYGSSLWTTGAGYLLKPAYDSIQQALASPTAQSAREWLEAREKELKERCGQLEVQLAGCLTAAEGWAKNPPKPGDYGWSPAFQAVLDLRTQLDARDDRIETETALMITKDIRHAIETGVTMGFPGNPDADWIIQHGQCTKQKIAKAVQAELMLRDVHDVAVEVNRNAAAKPEGR